MASSAAARSFSSTHLLEWGIFSDIEVNYLLFFSPLWLFQTVTLNLGRAVSAEKQR